MSPPPAVTKGWAAALLGTEPFMLLVGTRGAPFDICMSGERATDGAPVLLMHCTQQHCRARVRLELLSPGPAPRLNPLQSACTWYRYRYNYEIIHR